MDFKFITDGIDYTEKEKRIIDYFYQHLSRIPFLSIGQISTELGVSPSTLSRFVRHAGFQDYKELKASIMEFTEETPADKLSGTLTQSGKADVLSLLRHQQFCIAKTLENLSQKEALKAVEAIASAETVYLFGKGASSSLARLLEFRLRRFGKRTVVFSSSGSELFEQMVHVKPEDVVILSGFHKMPREAEVLLDYCRGTGCKTVLFSNKLYDDPLKRADINLFVYRGKVREYHSMAAPVALADALIIMTAERLGDAALAQLSRLYELKENYAGSIPR